MAKAVPSQLEIVLVLPGQRPTLTRQEAEFTVEQIEAVNREATKWRLVAGRPGRLLIIDPALASQVEATLASRERQDQ